MQGKALIFSAPSGSGKTTIVRHLINTFSDLQFSISATTRKPRNAEIDGKDYYFLSQTEFRNEQFVESEEVYNGVYYGTLKSEIERIWKEGKVVIFDVDVKGGINLKNYFGENALAVFVKVTDNEVIKKRLIDRSTESPKSLDARFSRIEYEMNFADKFELILPNDDLDKTLKEAVELVAKFLQDDTQ